MNVCVICKKEFNPGHFNSKKTCSKECLSELMRRKSKYNSGFKNGQFKLGREAINKGKKWNEYMSKESQKICSKTFIQYQKSSISPLSKQEGRYLPYNTYRKGTVVKRTTYHKKGKNAGKTETQYYINIDWKGNRKPNNLYKRYVWSKAHSREVPNGYIVYCIDGNQDNIVPENLDIMSRGDLAKQNRWGYKHN